MTSATLLRRLRSCAYVGVMVSLLFGTAHPVQPGISTRGTSGRGGLGSRFDSWSEGAAAGHDETEGIGDEARRTAAVGAARARGPNQARSASSPTVAVAPLVAISVDEPGTAIATIAFTSAFSRPVATSFGRAPPRG